MIFRNKTILITGGTGSLGRNLVRIIMSGKLGRPKQLIVFSRDEDKQYAMELEWKNLKVATDDVFYYDTDILGFRIGDVRDYESVVRAVKEAAYKGMEMHLNEGFRLETLLLTKLRQSEDAWEGPRAFAEKRKPNYKGR